MESVVSEIIFLKSEIQNSDLSPKFSLKTEKPAVFHHCRELSYLYHLLTICVTPTFDDREKLLVTSSQVEVDYRAATFDTKRLVDIGFVCSICLAVFEFYQPLCPICDSNMSLSYKNNGNENKKK